MKPNLALHFFSLALGFALNISALAETAEAPVQVDSVKVMPLVADTVAKAEPVATEGVAKVEPEVVDIDSGYQLGPEDVLEISVWKEDALKKEVLIRPDGGLSFPLIGGVQAAGKTVGQLKREIEQRLEKFIPDPVVSIALLKVVGNKIYVIGKVNKPGEFPAGRYVDVLQVLTMAGGLTSFAAENGIKVMRKEDGKNIVFPFRYSDVKNGEALEQNIQLKGGDVVVVP